MYFVHEGVIDVFAVSEHVEQQVDELKHLDCFGIVSKNIKGLMILFYFYFLDTRVVPVHPSHTHLHSGFFDYFVVFNTGRVDVSFGFLSSE